VRLQVWREQSALDSVSLPKPPADFERVIGSLLVAGLLKQRLALLPNEAVGQLMFDVVWNVMDAFSPELAICQVATERLLNSSSVVKTKKESVNQ
jgi:hypothetical protein